MIAALAGRRIDAVDADVPRFPLSEVDKVRQRITKVFTKHRVNTLVCAGACGADLIALDVAAELGLHRHLILPTERQTFREESVVDRPGNWGNTFDRITDEIAEAGELTELRLGKGQEAFLEGNRAILKEAESLAESQSLSLLAVIVWDGAPRGEDDITNHFLVTAKKRGFSIIEVLTL